jgi:hypothetical protein
MASGGAKNIILIIIAIGAIGGAVYLITQSTGGATTPQDEQMRHFVDPSTIGSGDPAGVSMTLGEFKDNQRAGTVKASNGEAENLVAAGKCPNGHYYALEGHGSMPASCSTCKVDLADYDQNGKLKTP